MSKQHICYSVRNKKKMKCQHDLVSGQSPPFRPKAMYVLGEKTNPRAVSHPSVTPAKAYLYMLKAGAEVQ